MKGLIAYPYKGSLYLNITNRCTNACTFCVRQWADGVGGNNLRLDREPTAAEIIAAVKAQDIYNEVIFCGFGEPLTRIDTVIEVAQYLKEEGKQVRINTNGQANLIHRRSIPPLLHGLVDKISISLNAANAEQYQAICQSIFGLEAYAGVCEFIAEAVQYIPEVRCTVLDLPGIDLNACQAVADRLGAKMVVRHASLPQGRHA